MTRASDRTPASCAGRPGCWRLVTATLVAFGIATIYGASSLVRAAEGGVVGGSYALTQFTGALVGGILMLVISHVDYRLLRPLAWPLDARLDRASDSFSVLPFTARDSLPASMAPGGGSGSGRC